jgi:hypothetical protein
MNAFERVMNTLQGLPVDRVPVFAVLGAYGGKLTQTDLRTLYRDAEAYVAARGAGARSGSARGRANRGAASYQ